MLYANYIFIFYIVLYLYDIDCINYIYCRPFLCETLFSVVSVSNFVEVYKVLFSAHYFCLLLIVTYLFLRFFIHYVKEGNFQIM